MPTGGRTPLGQELNRLDRKSTGTRQRQKPTPRIGRIIESRSVSGEDLYEVQLQWITPPQKRGERSGWLPLEEPAEALAQRFGSPRDLKTKGYYCKVDFSGTSSSRGVAKIIENPFYDIQDTAAWNELEIQGATFAPPGSGMI